MAQRSLYEAAQIVLKADRDQLKETFGVGDNLLDALNIALHKVEDGKDDLDGLIETMRASDMHHMKASHLKRKNILTNRGGDWSFTKASTKKLQKLAAQLAGDAEDSVVESRHDEELSSTEVPQPKTVPDSKRQVEQLRRTMKKECEEIDSRIAEHEIEIQKLKAQREQMIKDVRELVAHLSELVENFDKPEGED